MRRLLVTACSLFVVGGVVAGDVAASAPRERLHQFVCKRALDPAARRISVVAVMRPMPGTKHMELKFDLFSKTKRSASSIAVSGGDLGRWLKPGDPTLGQQPGDVWELKHPVVNLAAPAVYRYQVSFRWIGTHHSVLGTEVRWTKDCYQPELRPDLMVVSIQIKSIPSQPNNDRYTALIRNGGRTAAGPFQVWFSYGDVVVKRTLGGLASHSTVKESFVGPLCTTDTAPTVTADPTHQIDDYNPSNNSMVANCSGSGAAPSGP